MQSLGSAVLILTLVISNWSFALSQQTDTLARPSISIAYGNSASFTNGHSDYTYGNGMHIAIAYPITPVKYFAIEAVHHGTTRYGPRIEQGVFRGKQEKHHFELRLKYGEQIMQYGNLSLEFSGFIFASLRDNTIIPAGKDAHRVWHVRRSIIGIGSELKPVFQLSDRFSAFASIDHALVGVTNYRVVYDDPFVSLKEQFDYDVNLLLLSRGINWSVGMRYQF